MTISGNTKKIKTIKPQKLNDLDVTINLFDDFQWPWLLHQLLQLKVVLGNLDFNFWIEFNIKLVFTTIII
jgi:hypothetical protein